MREVWDLYRGSGEKAGITVLRGDPIPEGLYHLSVSTWIRNGTGQYLLSQRHPDKQYPLLWECTGGCALSGEDSLQTAVREVGEELGVALDPGGGALIYRERREQPQDFYDVWLFQADFDLGSCILQKEEVVAARWALKEQIAELFRQGKLHPLLSYFAEVIP